MSTISVDVSSSKIPVLQVGYQGENEVTEVLFNISSWIEEYGGGTAQIRVKRPQNSEDESYLLSLPISDGVATWTVTSLDTANKGNGKVQLNYLVGTAIKDSVIYPYKVGKSIVGADSPVDPYDSWIERSKAWAIGELLDDEEVPPSDETYRNNSKFYAEQADASAEEAETQAVEAKAQADTAKQYAHQFVGAPRAASASSAMTDHDLIYVFTGTTTSSLTNGHWYYWNGSAWTDGGVYNSTAFTTDTTLSVSGAAADAKVVGDLKEDIDAFLPLIKVKNLVLNKGGIERSEGGVNTTDATRLHTPLTMCNAGDLIKVPSGYNFAVFYYTIADDYVGNSYDQDGGWYKSQELAVVPQDCLVSVVIAKTDDSAFTENECLALNESIELYSSNVKKIGGVVFGAGHIDTANQSNVWGLHGNDYVFRAWSESKPFESRWRTESETLFHKGATIEVADGYRFYIFTYVNGTVVNSFWRTRKYTFDNDTVARIIVDTLTGSTPYTEWGNLADIVTIVNDVNIIETDKKIADIENKVDVTHKLRIGTLVNGHLVATGVVDDEYTNYRLSTKEIVAFPCGSKKAIKVSINDGYLFAMRTGATSTNLNNNLYWYSDGDVVTIPDGDNYYAISICNAAGDSSHTASAISPSEYIGLSLSYEDNFEVLNSNDEPSKVLSNARLFFSENALNTINKYAVIGHTSDCHGDYKRVDNFLRFCDNCGADVACVTGDIVSYQPSQQIKWFNDLLLEHKTLPAVCTGNHDVYGNSLTDSDIYDFMFADIATKIGNATGKTWYYKDIASKKLRVISVNLYQYGGESRWYTHFTDEQLAWIVSTIASTPNDYGIIILSHASQVNLDNAKDADYGEFFQDARLYNNTHNSVSGGVPLYDIVDAFISRTTLSKTYTQTGSPSSVSVSADFSNVDSSVEFIAHLTGHFHQDSICYVPNRTNKQLMLNVTCTNAIYGGASYPYLADIQDQARNNTDATQDAFNMYVVDRDNKTVKVVRIGNNITYQMKDRKYMEIPYSD